jgi:hypothetical protein
MTEEATKRVSSLRLLAEAGTASDDRKGTEQDSGYGLFDGVDVFVSLSGSRSKVAMLYCLIIVRC